MLEQQNKEAQRIWSLVFLGKKDRENQLSRNFIQILLRSTNDNEILLCIIHSSMIY